MPSGVVMPLALSVSRSLPELVIDPGVAVNDPIDPAPERTLTWKEVVEETGEGLPVEAWTVTV